MKQNRTFGSGNATKIATVQHVAQDGVERKMSSSTGGGHVYTIGDLADFFGITHRALRFYEDKGMLKPRRVGQKRLYSNKDRTKLRLILNGKQIGMKIREIQDFLDSYELRDGNDVQMRKALANIRSQRLLLKQRRESIEMSLQELERVEKIIAGMVEDGQKIDD